MTKTFISAPSFITSSEKKKTSYSLLYTMKRLLPSLREKKRYIVYEVQQNASKEQVFASLQNALQEFLGILGMSHVNPEIMKDKQVKRKGIIRINQPYKDEVIAALSLSKVKVEVVGVSGILKKAEQKFLEG